MNYIDAALATDNGKYIKEHAAKAGFSHFEIVRNIIIEYCPYEFGLERPTIDCPRDNNCTLCWNREYEKENEMKFTDNNGNTYDESELFTQDDPVNHPAHYTAGGIECIDAIAAALSCHTNPMHAWLTGQCLKYLWRWPLKNHLEDLKKTQFYLNRLIESVEKGDNK